MNDYSTTVGATAVRVLPAPTRSRNCVILSAPGASCASGGSGDLSISFTQGPNTAPGAPGTFLLQGGQTMVLGDALGEALRGGFGNIGIPVVPSGEIWAVAVRGGSAPLTVLANDYG